MFFNRVHPVFVFSCCFAVQLLLIVHLKRKLRGYFLVVSFCNSCILYTVTQIDCLSFKYLSACLLRFEMCIYKNMPSIDIMVKETWLLLYLTTENSKITLKSRQEKVPFFCKSYLLWEHFVRSNPHNIKKILHKSACPCKYLIVSKDTSIYSLPFLKQNLRYARPLKRNRKKVWKVGFLNIVL